MEAGGEVAFSGGVTVGMANYSWHRCTKDQRDRARCFRWRKGDASSTMRNPRTPKTHPDNCCPDGSHGRSNHRRSVARRRAWIVLYPNPACPVKKIGLRRFSFRRFSAPFHLCRNTRHRISFPCFFKSTIYTMSGSLTVCHVTDPSSSLIRLRAKMRSPVILSPTTPAFS